MTQDNGNWVRRRTAALLAAALVASPVLSAPLTALANDGQPVAASSTEQPETGSGTEDAPGTETSPGGGTEDAPEGDTGTATGVATIDGQSYDTLEAAIAAASEGQTITLTSNVELAAPVDLPAGVTLDGNGHELTCTAEVASGALVNVTNANVTVKNLTVNTAGLVKHGIQFYCTTGGTIEGCTVNGGRYTAVCVNGSQVTIKDTVLNPDEGAYASVEYGMGSGVTSVPAVSLEGVTTKSQTAPLVYVDSATMSRVAENSDPKIEATDTQAIVDKINSSLTGAQVSLDESGSATTGKPSDPEPDPDPNPPAQTGEPVKVQSATGGSIKVSASRADAGDTVTVTLTPNEGQKVGTVTVTDAEGNEVEVTPGEKDGQYTFVMPDSAVSVSATFVCDGGEHCPTHAYPDVDQDDWYHAAVDWAAENDVMTGYATGDFGPDDAISRAQMATVLWRLAGSPETSTSGLPADCSADSFYGEAVAWALEDGAFTGYATGDFGPADNLTREQAATVLWRSFGSPQVEGDLSSYPDADEVSDFAEDAMRWAVSEGIITGENPEEGVHLLDPQGTCSRAELAAILMRISDSE